jgi:hypothetical protein
MFFSDALVSQRYLKHLRRVSAVFFYNNYFKNLNFNNKSYKIEILRIRMAARQSHWRICAETPLGVGSFIFFLKKI